MFFLGGGSVSVFVSDFLGARVFPDLGGGFEFLGLRSEFSRHPFEGHVPITVQHKNFPRHTTCKKARFSTSLCIFDQKSK